MVIRLPKIPKRGREKKSKKKHSNSTCWYMLCCIYVLQFQTLSRTFCNFLLYGQCCCNCFLPIALFDDTNPLTCLSAPLPFILLAFLTQLAFQQRTSTFTSQIQDYHLSLPLPFIVITPQLLMFPSSQIFPGARVSVFACIHHCPKNTFGLV